jgi:adenine phosphoribosyltransferase
MDPTLGDRLCASIRNVPGFPKPGIVFRDITTLLLRPDLLKEALEAMWEPFGGKADVIAGIESRGFILGAVIALSHRLPFVPLRKPGKLPSLTVRESYALEYGTDALEVHQDAIGSGHRVLIVDDLLATGGTATAAARLIERCGGEVAGFSFLVELAFLKGRERLQGYNLRSLVRFETE